MQTSALESVLDYLRKQVSAEAIKDLSDTELLERFCRRREEAAFTLLLQRHGPAVLSVCRRMLGDVHAAEDAFQATFLVLVRKVDCVRKRQSLGSFLYGVAYRTAARVRAQATERRSRDRAAVVSSYQPDALEELSRAEACAVLHEELARLPDKYRRPLVLCYLEGKTQEQAGREMAWPRRSVSDRMKRGCELLRKRLSRRGVALSAGALALLVADQSARAVPALLTLSTVRLAAQALAGKATAATAAVGLVAGVLKAMIATRTGVLLTLLLTVGLAVAGMGVLASQQEESKPPPAAKPAEKPQAEPIAAVRNDEYGDPLPDGALARLGTVRLRHLRTHQVVFSADGKKLLSTGADCVVRRWDVLSGKLIGAQSFTLPPQDSDASPFLSPDGKTLVCVGQEALYFLDAVTGKELRRFPMDKRYQRGEFTADGAQFAVVTFKGEVLLLDVATGKPVKTGLPAELGSNEIALDRSGKLLAAFDLQKTFSVALWDLPAGKSRGAFPAATSALKFIFSPDGGKLLVTSYGELFIWNTATGMKEGAFPIPSSISYDTCFSADGAQIACSSIDRILLLDTKTMKEIRTIPNKACDHFRFSPDGKTLAGFGGGAIHLWNVSDGKPLHDFHGQNDAWNLVYSPDGTCLATGGGGMICFWDMATMKLRNMIRTGYFGHPFVFSSDGQTLFGGAEYGTVKAWRVADGKEMAAFLSSDDKEERSDQHVVSLHLSSEGKQLTACLWEAGKGKNRLLDNRLIVWNVLSGKQLDCTTWPATRPMTIAPDGKRLAYPNQNSLILSDFDKKQERILSPCVQARPYTFSPDGALLAMPSSDPFPTANLAEAFATIVETATGRVRIKLPPGTGAANAFTPDNRFLFTTNPTEFRLWELATGKEVLRRPVEGMPSWWHDDTFAHQAAVAPDGRTVATSLPTGSILIWDLLPSSRLKGDLTAKDLESLWADLAGEDAAKAYYAGGRLLSAPDGACTLLSKGLRPTDDDDEAKHIRSLIAALDDDEFAKREAAKQELRRLGSLAELELRRALDDKASAEMRLSIGVLLDGMKIVWKADERRQTRAIWVLEQIGSSDARKTLERLAGGAAAARQTREAKSALQRLKAKK